MTISVIGATPDGWAYIYHTRGNPDGTTNEHFFVARVRQSDKSNYTYCHLCDSVSARPRTGGDEEARRVEGDITEGRLTGLPAPQTVDPLVLGREDQAAPRAVARKIIPPLIPVDADGRRQLIAQLRSLHVDEWP